MSTFLLYVLVAAGIIVLPFLVMAGYFIAGAWVNRRKNERTT
jgi:uncharacterized membrane protein YjgN (DUF898 family)